MICFDGVAIKFLRQYGHSNSLSGLGNSHGLIDFVEREPMGDELMERKEVFHLRQKLDTPLQMSRVIIVNPQESEPPEHDI